MDNTTKITGFSPLPGLTVLVWLDCNNEPATVLGRIALYVLERNKFGEPYVVSILNYKAPESLPDDNPAKWLNRAKNTENYAVYGGTLAEVLNASAKNKNKNG